MSKKHTLTLAITFSLPEEHDGLVIGDIPHNDLPVIGLTRELTASLDGGPERPFSGEQTEWVEELLGELLEGALTEDGQIVLKIIAGPRRAVRI